MPLRFRSQDDVFEKMKAAAESRQQPLDAFVTDVMNDAMRNLGAEERFRERAARRKGREQEGLALLRR